MPGLDSHLEAMVPWNGQLILYTNGTNWGGYEASGVGKGKLIVYTTKRGVRLEDEEEEEEEEDGWVKTKVAGKSWHFMEQAMWRALWGIFICWAD